MSGLGTRLAVVTLVALAMMFLALSFVPWDSATAAIATPTVAPTQSPAEAGRALFALKGCATCHRHDGQKPEQPASAGPPLSIEHETTGMFGAPDLTNYRPDPDFVRTWLKDPKAVRPYTLMPNLGLSAIEIEALLAFLEE